MSDQQDFKDPSSFGSLAVALVALISFPLLPMLMGWYSVLS